MTGHLSAAYCIPLLSRTGAAEAEMVYAIYVLTHDWMIMASTMDDKTLTKVHL